MCVRGAAAVRCGARALFAARPPPIAPPPSLARARQGSKPTSRSAAVSGSGGIGSGGPPIDGPAAEDIRL